MTQDWVAQWQPLIDQVGEDLSDSEVTWGAERVEPGGIRRLLEVLEFDCVLHRDPDAARASGFDDVTLPYTGVLSWTIPAMWEPGGTLFDSADRDAQPVSSPISTPPLPGAPPTSGFFATGMDIDFLRPVVVGERIGRRGFRLVSCVPKETKVGRGAFITRESEIVSDRGDVVALVRIGTYSYQPRSEYEGEVSA